MSRITDTGVDFTVELGRSSYDNLHVTFAESQASTDPLVLPRAANEVDSARATSAAAARQTVGVNNMDELVYLHQASVLNNVRKRFAKDVIYTYTGPILIAVNPFKQLPLYSPDTMQEYHSVAELAQPQQDDAFTGGDSSNAVAREMACVAKLPPHCFATAVSPLWVWLGVFCTDP